MTRRTFGSIRRLKSGKYQGRYVGPDGVRYSAPQLFVKRAHASTWLAWIETAISNGSWAVNRLVEPQASQGFGCYADAWLAGRTDLKPRTHSEYRRILAGPRLAPLRLLDLTEITPAVVKTWFAGLPVITPTENAHTYSLLSTIMSAAAEDETTGVEVNPCQVKNGGSVKRAKVITVLSDAQVRALADALGPKHAALVLVSAYCCLRFGELTELRRKDLVDGVLHIRRGVTWVETDLLTVAQLAEVRTGTGGRPRKEVPVVGSPKSVAGVRDIPVPGFLRSVLAEHILAYAEPGEDGLIFPGARGGHMAHGSLYSVFSPARRAIGREDLSWHDLRHTGAVSLRAGGSDGEGTDADARARDLGHGDPLPARRRGSPGHPGGPGVHPGRVAGDRGDQDRGRGMTKELLTGDVLDFIPSPTGLYLVHEYDGNRSIHQENTEDDRCNHVSRIHATRDNHSTLTGEDVEALWKRCAAMPAQEDPDVPGKYWPRLVDGYGFCRCLNYHRESRPRRPHQPAGTAGQRSASGSGATTVRDGGRARVAVVRVLPTVKDEMTPEQRTLRAKLAAHTSWANTTRTGRREPGRRWTPRWPGSRSRSTLTVCSTPPSGSSGRRPPRALTTPGWPSSRSRPGRPRPPAGGGEGPRSRPRELR